MSYERVGLAVVLLMVAVVPAAAQYSAHQNGDVVELRDGRTGTVVTIVPSVGNMAVQLKVNGHDILYWPYTSVEAFKARPIMSGIPLLAPWANRLDETAFYANHRRYPFDLELGNVTGPIPIHGLVTATADWKVTELEADAGSAWVTSRLDFFRRPAWMKQWPFAHTIEMSYRLQNGTLEVRTRIANLATEPMPIAIGFHPYFQLTDSTRDEWRLTVGARTHWLLAQNKIPTGQTEPIERLLPAPARLADYDLDDVFDDLVRDEQGRATISIAGKAQRLDVVLGPNYRAAVIWAPKVLPAGGRAGFICIEPMAGITDALNLAEKGIYKKLQSIPPGGMWQESFFIRPTGF